MSGKVKIPSSFSSLVVTDTMNDAKKEKHEEQGVGQDIQDEPVNGLV